MKLFKRWRKGDSAKPANEAPPSEPASASEQAAASSVDVDSPSSAPSAAPQSTGKRRRPATLGRTALELDYLAEAAQRAQGQSSTQ